MRKIPFQTSYLLSNSVKILFVKRTVKRNYTPWPVSSSITEQKKGEVKAKIDFLSKKYRALSKNIGLTWFIALEEEFYKDYFYKLSKFLSVEQQNYVVYPPEEMMYMWTQFFNIHETKVVILGQDPYYRPNQANGLAFSVPVGEKIPFSLQNIYKEIQSDLGKEKFIIPKHGSLAGWAFQGVLLLNSFLTVRANVPCSHRNCGWEKFTHTVIKCLNNNASNIVFLLWGAYAKKKRPIISEIKHLILTAAHPSPLSAEHGFFGCRHFSKANAYLEKHNKKPIDWNYLPDDYNICLPNNLCI